MTPNQAQIQETGIAPAMRTAVVAGGAAGAITVTGITPQDSLASVIQLIGGGTDVTDAADLTGEFTISADDTIDNTGGTDTTGDKLLVMWFKASTE